MLVDDFDQYPAEKTDVVVVSRSGSDEPESAPTADDRMFFVAPLPPDHKQHSRLASYLDKAWDLNEIVLEKCTSCLLVCTEYSLTKSPDGYRRGDDGKGSPPELGPRNPRRGPQHMALVRLAEDGAQVTRTCLPMR